MSTFQTAAESMGRQEPHGVNCLFPNVMDVIHTWSKRQECKMNFVLFFCYYIARSLLKQVIVSATSIYLVLLMCIHGRREYLKLFRVMVVNGAYSSILLDVPYLLKHNVDYWDC